MELKILSAVLILLPMASAVFIYHTRKLAHLLTSCVLAVELAAAVMLTGFVGEAFELPGVCGLGLNFSDTGLQSWLCILAGFLWLVSGLFSGKYLKQDSKNNRYYLFLLLTEGAIMGVFLSADLFTTLVFFETMSFASYPLVIHHGTQSAIRAGASYLSYAVIGGMVSLMGLFLLWTLLGTLRYTELAEAVSSYNGDSKGIFLAGCLALVTFAAKVCMFPLHTWLPGSYGEAPSPATALLSGIITKAGVFGIFGLTAKLFEGSHQWGNLILICGIITALVGGTLALFNTNLKQTIAYSSMSQIGFILVGTGMTALLGEENGLAVWGSILHLTNHSFIKLVLLLVGGVIVYNVGQLDYDVVRGFGRGKPALAFAFLMPALGVMGVPGWNGYISKTMIHEAIVEYIEELEHLGEAADLYHVIEWLFLIAGGMTVGYMTKLFVCIFLEKNTNPTVQAKYDTQNKGYASKLWLFLLDGCALMFPVLGFGAHATQDKIAAFAQDFFGSGVEEHIDYFSVGNLKGAGISLAIGVVLYVGFVRTLIRTKDGYRNRWPKMLDLENRLYVPLLFTVLPFVGAFCARFVGSLFEWASKLVNKVLFFRYNKYVTPGEDHYFARYKAEDPGVRGYRGQLAYGLALFGTGFVVVIAFLLISNGFLF
ncbi:MAG: sodium:proton antiporter [Oscillospiraceae bacterium]|nr:sodium:proton antiporter [Oscillospiraceae bacterium]